MMMMMMTLMKLVNSATKFRHGMDKFYQPNSGLRGSKSRDEAIYTHTCLHAFDFTHRISFDSGWHNFGWVRSRYICQLTSNIQYSTGHHSCFQLEAGHMHVSLFNTITYDITRLNMTSHDWNKNVCDLDCHSPVKNGLIALHLFRYVLIY